MPFLLALDQGTTSSRAIVYDETLTVRGHAAKPLAQYFPEPGHVEQDALGLWQDQRDVAMAAIANAGIPASSIEAVGITNQRETLVLWDRRTGEPLHRALVWQDRRTADACQRLRAEGLEAEIQARSGLVIDPYFSASKLAWLLDHCPGARARAARGELAAGTIDTWLIWQLSGRRTHITDASNASRTQLYNLHTGSWDPELLRWWNIPVEVLPEITDSIGTIATITALPGVDAPLAGLAGDQQAALFGQGCFSPGEAKCTYGTGCFILQHTGRNIPCSANRLLTTVAWSRAGEREFALEGSVFMGGALVQWLRDGLGIIDSAAAIEALAASVKDSDGVVLVPAFTGLGAPWWDAEARGLIIGLTRGTGRAHLARAALEAIALQIHDVLSAMTRDTGVALSTLKVDGGASANALLMQMQADVLGCTLRQPADLETTARGAAAMAGIGCGLWSDTAQLANLLGQGVREYRPVTEAGAVWAPLISRWHEAVGRAGHWQHS
ncbi:MAG: glycerol kinase GlpK [Gammaproteobacteria bacterium]|nr:glycerol kinase GlpK [Gammaproteobacteria bacterium]